jgi:hypothetical protein
MSIRRARWLVPAAVVVIAASAGVLVVASPASAVAGRVVVSATSPETGSEGFKGANAVCPTGTKILGGGADIVGGNHHVQLAGINPAPLGLPANSMWATANEGPFGYDGSWSLRAWAVCGTGVSGHQIVEASSAPPAGATSAAATAACPAGKKVIGAGGRSAGKPSYVLDTMDVSASLSSVFVETMATEVVTPGTAPVAVAYAICINPVPGQQRVGAATAFDSNDKTLTVICPAGTRVHGTGGGITGALGQAYLDALLPSGGAPGGTHINAREDANGFAGNWMVNAYAVCAN